MKHLLPDTNLVSRVKPIELSNTEDGTQGRQLKIKTIAENEILSELVHASGPNH